MFDKFGEFDSMEEINMAAEGLFNEGDFGSLRELAKENGIPTDYAEMYLNGETWVLCDDPLTAALGKIEVECAELKPTEIMADWVEYLKSQCMDYEEMAVAVRRKGKSLAGCLGMLLAWSVTNMYTVNAKIRKAAGMDNLMKKYGPKGAKSSETRIGIPGMGRAKSLIRDYYLGGSEK